MKTIQQVGLQKNLLPSEKSSKKECNGIEFIQSFSMKNEVKNNFVASNNARKIKNRKFLKTIAPFSPSRGLISASLLQLLNSTISPLLLNLLAFSDTWTKEIVL